MKKTILMLGLVLLTMCPVLAQKKVSQYPEATLLGTNDLVLISYWNGSSWTTNKFIRSTNLFAQINALGIWTNNVGTIQASSTVADVASAVAFSLNSSISAEGARMVALNNNGTNIYGFDPDGVFYINGPANTEIQMFSQVGGGYIDISADGDDAYIQVLVGPSFNGFSLDPSVSASATPYSYNTTTTHSSGNLVEVQNNDTNKFTIDYLGGVTTGLPTGATNAQPFKIGSEANAIGLVLVATNYIQIELNGVAYKLGLVQ